MRSLECPVTFPEGSTLYGCRVCDFDICMDCCTWFSASKHQDVIYYLFAGSFPGPSYFPWSDVFEFLCLPRDELPGHALHSNVVQSPA